MFRLRICVLMGFLLLGLLVHAAPADLVLRFGFDDGAGTVVPDDSGNGFDGTIQDAQWQAGGFNGKGACMNFSGGGSVENAPVADSLNGLEAMTVMAWVKSNIVNTDNGFINFSTPNGGDNGGMRYDAASWAFPGGTNCITVVMPNTGTRARLESASNLQVTEWQHVAMVWASGEGVSLFVDGVQDTNPTGVDAAGTGTVSSVDMVLVGKSAKNDAAGSSWDGLIDEVRVYDAALTEAEIQTEMVSSGGRELASSPQPGDGSQDVLRDSSLAWAPGQYAVTHDLYLGTSFDDVNDATTPDAAGLNDVTYNPGRLDFGQTYYWRIDEVNAPANPATFKGDVWSFTVEQVAYPITPIAATASSSFMPTMGAEKTIDGSGLNDMDQHGTSGSDMWLTSTTDTERWIQYEFGKPQKLHEMWVWNSNQAIESFIGFGLKSVTIETSLDGSTWTALTRVPEFAQAPGSDGYAHDTVVAFAGVTARYVKLSVISGHGSLPQFGLSEVRFMAIPVYASQPEPTDGGSVDSVDLTLAWRPGREADTHEVVLSSDLADVESGSAVIGNPADSSITPPTLIYGTEYFWAINEVNAVAETGRYEGDIWNFTAPEYLVIDDFEMYKDEEFLEIWAFWADGYNDDTNGSLVGNGNIGERSVVYEGRQSMPIHYDNSAAAISEVTRTFAPPLDWLKGEPNTLSLHLRGDAPSFIDGGDTLTVGGSGADIWNVADEFRFVYKTLNGDGSITAKVESLTHVNTWAKAGVMIRESLTAESSCAYTVATGAEGVTFQYRTAAFTNAASDSSTRDATWADQDDEPVWVRVERVGDTFNGYLSLDGVTWMPSVSNPQTIVMLPEVKIGFCVTSHDNNQSSTAVFSNVSTSGSVSGVWATEVFGEGHPDNDPAPMYLVVTDASGREKRVSHPDTNVTISTNWAPWQIPLDDMGSVNLGSIEKIAIGVGEPGGSATGDQGTVYVDLLQVGTPIPIIEDPNAATVE